MKEFKFSLFNKIYIIGFVAFITCISFIICPQLLMQIGGSNTCFVVIMFAFFLVLFVFGIYVLNVLIGVSFDKYKCISVDVQHSCFLMKAKNNQVIRIPFSEVVNVSMYAGMILRGLYAGHIVIQTQSNKLYGVSISDMYSFLAVITPLNMEKKFVNKLYYRSWWNKISKQFLI